MIGCVTPSVAPRGAASYCRHQVQTFFPNEKRWSWRPHLTQFAIGFTQDQFVTSGPVGEENYPAWGTSLLGLGTPFAEPSLRAAEGSSALRGKRHLHSSSASNVRRIESVRGCVRTPLHFAPRGWVTKREPKRYGVATSLPARLKAAVTLSWVSTLSVVPKA